MLKNVSNTFINACNDKSLTLSEFIVLNGVSIPIKAVLKDDCYQNGNFVGNFIFKTINFECDNTYDFKNKEFEYYKVVNGESIKMGTFITTEVQDDDSTELVKVIGMDYGLKTQVEYNSTLDYTTGNITLLDVWNECCSLSGLQSGINSFTNDDFVVDGDQFTGYGVTIRDVLIAIAQASASFVKVMNDDKLYLIFNENTTDIIEDYTDLQDKRDTHPITCVRLGMSQIDGENVDLKDDELVEEYGENWLIINDNPFAYNQDKREELITAILDKVKGFGYSSFKSTTSFKPYLTCGDVIRFRNKAGTLTSSIILRYEQNYDEITLEAPSETSASVNYVYPTKEIDVIKRTQIIVDKSEQEITSLVETTGDLNENIVDLTNDVDSYKEENNSAIQTLSTQITQNNERVQTQINQINQDLENGVTTLQNTLVTIDINGITISTGQSIIQTLITNDNFIIQTEDGTKLAYFGYDNETQSTLARMDNLTVDTYFITGYHRFEKFDIDGEHRTGVFYIGE